MDLRNEQMYDCDESAMFQKTIADAKWVHQNEKVAPRRKTSNYILTFMP